MPPGVGEPCTVSGSPEQEQSYPGCWALAVKAELCVVFSVAQSCLTLCNSMDCRLPGSSVRGIFPGKNTGVGCHSLL